MCDVCSKTQYRIDMHRSSFKRGEILSFPFDGCGVDFVILWLLDICFHHQTSVKFATGNWCGVFGASRKMENASKCHFSLSDLLEADVLLKGRAFTTCITICRGSCERAMRFIWLHFHILHLSDSPTTSLVNFGVYMNLSIYLNICKIEKQNLTLMDGFSLGKFFRQASGAAARHPQGAWLENDWKHLVQKKQQATAGSQKHRGGEKGGEDCHEQRGWEEGCKERGWEEGEEGEGKTKENPSINTEMYWSPTANTEVSFFMFISTRTSLPFTRPDRAVLSSWRPGLLSATRWKRWEGVTQTGHPLVRPIGWLAQPYVWS